MEFTFNKSAFLFSMLGIAVGLILVGLGFPKSGVLVGITLSSIRINSGF